MVPRLSVGVRAARVAVSTSVVITEVEKIAARPAALLVEIELPAFDCVDDMRGNGRDKTLDASRAGAEQYARTREFYPKHGYVEEARIRRFYGPDDNKVVYWKLLAL